MSGSVPASSRMRLPSRRHSLGSCVWSSFQNCVALGGAVDHVLDAHRPHELGALGTRHHRHRCATAVEHVLARVRADAAAGTPDQDRLALRHPRAVRAHQHPVARGVGQRVDRGFLPREVRGFGHELVRLHQRELTETAVVGLVAPDALVRRQHRVVVRARVLVVDVVAVHRDRVTGLPRTHRRADAQHHTGGVAADHVERLVVTRAPHALASEPLQEPERGHRLEDRRPHGVEVHRRRHHRDQRLVGRQLGERHLVEVQRLAGILLRRRHARRTSPARRPAPPHPGTNRAAGGHASSSPGAPSRIASRIAPISPAACPTAGSPTGREATIG